MNRNMKQYIGKIFTLAFILWNVNAGAQSQYDVIVNTFFVKSEQSIDICFDVNSHFF